MKENKLKVLIYDIESGGVNALKPDLGFVLCFGYKWLGEKETHCLTLDQFDGFKKGSYNDKELLKTASKIMNEADLLVAHFGDYFDRKFINGRLAINGLSPISNVKQVDTCKLAWKAFNFSSNRLKQLAKTLGCKNRKSESEFPNWWLSVLAGSMEPLKKMATYCKQDVRTLEEVYLKLRPFYDKHPVMTDVRDNCPTCDSGKVQSRGQYRAVTRTYQRLYCKSCGHWFRSSKFITHKEE